MSSINACGIVITSTGRWDNTLGTISVSLPSDGTTADVADYNTPITTIVDEINGNLDNDNIASDASIAGSKLADGGVTPAKLTNAYKFRVYRNAALNSASASFSTVNFDTESYDSNNNFDSTTNFRYTAPVAGFYHFSYQITSAAAASRWVAALYKNTSTEISRGSDVPTSLNPNASVGSDTVQLAANDTVEVKLFANAAIALQVGGQNFCFFSGYLVTQT